jgi:protein gp37
MNITGGESGPNARDCHVRWIRSIVRFSELECGVKKLHDRAGADPSEWVEDLRVRQLP